MSGLIVVVAAFILALIASAFLFGVGILAIPIFIVGVGVAAAMAFTKRRKQATMLHAHRELARTEKVNFTERDEQTLVSD
jgi:Na+-translocating ferredoxin:NAD+ oxidoreductase RnfD subunit